MRAVSVKSAGAVVMLALVVSLTACSYSAQFVIVNNSTQTLYVEYRGKEVPGKFAPPETPSILPASELNSNGKNDWTKLEFGQYTVNPEQRTVSVQIKPGQAFLVCSRINYPGHNDTLASDFPVTQIRLEGASGAFIFSGDEARTKFSRISLVLYVLDYK